MLMLPRLPRVNAAIVTSRHTSTAVVDYYCRHLLPGVPLEEVPPLVLSEVMRDADLFVGVASVGNDPN